MDKKNDLQQSIMRMPKLKEDLTSLQQSKYFCIKAFVGLSITPSGACAPCCLFEKMITKENGDMYKIWEDDVKDIYNSAFMNDVREKMISGEEVAACRQCYQVEAHGGYSLRNSSNATEFSMLNEADTLFTPSSLDLKLNNKCNLKCRMCQPRDSHLIYNEFKKIGEKDSSFNLYSNADLIDPDLKIPLADVPDWSESESFQKQFQTILSTTKKISIVGGEPLILEEVYKLLDACVREDRAKDIFLIFTSNLMHVPLERLEKQLPHFKQVLFNISLDAVGRELNYIRFPSDFERIVENFKKLQKLNTKSHIWFQFTPTVQVYNILCIDEVYRFVEKLLNQGYQFTRTPLHLTFLEFPTHLNIRILPENVRAIAAKKLQKLFTELPVLMKHALVKANLTQLIEVLNQDRIENHDYVPEFLHYTNVLDQERKQKFEDCLPELHTLLADYSPTPPVESFHKTRERGWKLAQEGKLSHAIEEFERSLLTSTNKELDLREIAWMKMSLGHHEESRSYYERAYALDKKDPYVLKGLALQYKISNDITALRKILDLAISSNPDDTELLNLKSFLGTVK